MKERENRFAVLLTAGPTREALDPVRYLTNASSGEMGIEIARALCKRGAAVTVVAGPLSKALPKKIQHIPVITAREMSRAVQRELPRCDVFIAAAAVSDWRFASRHRHKLKKGTRKTLTVRLVANPDILAEAGAWKKKMSRRKPVLIGFALETSKIVQAMNEMLKRKNLDLIIGNTPSSFGSKKINVFWLERGAPVRSWGIISKSDLAYRLTDWIYAHG